MESPQQKEQDCNEGGVIPTHIRGLNGLRALAILLVLCRHLFYLYYEQFETNASPGSLSALDFLAPVFLNGWIGVDLFFVLSGFLIARPFFHSADNRISVRVYALKRIFRIVPAYYFVMALIVLGAFPFYPLESDNLGWRAFYHMIFLQDYLPSDINIVFWSLGVEEKFYFLVPLMFLALPFIKSDKIKASIFIAVILMTPGLRWLSFQAAENIQTYGEFFRSVRAPFHCCLEPLFLGLLIAQCERKGWRPFPPKLVFACSAVALAILLASHKMLEERTMYDVLIQPLLIAVIMAGLVYGVVFGVRLKLLENIVADFFSRISYSLYLLHWPLFPLAYLTTMSYASAAGWNVYLTFFIYAGLYTVLSILLAAAQYYAVERPFLKIKNRIRAKTAN